MEREDGLRSWKEGDLPNVGDGKIPPMCNGSKASGKEHRNAEVVA
jgi:hypothetical protein